MRGVVMWSEMSCIVEIILDILGYFRIYTVFLNRIKKCNQVPWDENSDEIELYFWPIRSWKSASYQSSLSIMLVV